MKSGGCTERGGRERRGLDGMWQRVRKSPGREAGTGLTFLATFLYAARTEMGGLEGRRGFGSVWCKQMASAQGGRTCTAHTNV